MINAIHKTHEPTLCRQSACSSAHMVQFYRNPEYLAISIAEYIRLGLSLGEAALVIARPGHWMKVKASLKTLDVDVEHLLATKQIVFLNAVSILERILINEVPSRIRFFDIFFPIQEQMVRVSPKLRCYGEIVDLLCAQNKIEEAVTVEGFWNEILEANPSVSLMCGYHASHLRCGHDLDEFQTVIDLHSDVIEVENFRANEDEDALFRKIAVLEQRSVALKNHLEEKRKIDDELSATKSQLIQFGKLSILGELCAGIAHELNNPLAIIRGSVIKSKTLLKRIISNPTSALDDTMTRLEHIDEAASRMTKIVNKVLLFARQQSPSFSHYDVKAVLLSAVELYRNDLSNFGIGIEMSLSEESVYSFGDPDLIMQVFLNIISNARDAMGSVTDDRTRRLSVSVAQLEGAGEVEVIIADSGTGMDANTLAKVFYPFFTTKEIGKGTGLGLAISHGIIKEHQGKILCESCPDVGSSFRILLPAVEGSSHERYPQQSRQRSRMAKETMH